MQSYLMAVVKAKHVEMFVPADGGRAAPWSDCDVCAGNPTLYRAPESCYLDVMSKLKVLFEGYRFRVEEAVQTSPDGSRHVREVIRHPGAVVILPLLGDGRICLLRNYRVAVDQTLLELPAGTLEPGEEPAATALRELAEESGYRAGRMRHLITFCMSPGILDERMHLFLAEDLQPGPMALEAGEDIEPILCTWDEALEMARNGDIRDAKTLVGLLYYATFHKAATGWVERP
jgi:ADP-ribose pyrophosphatase